MQGQSRIFVQGIYRIVLKFLPELKRLGKESRAAVLWIPVLF